MLAFNGSSDYLTLPIVPAVTGFNLSFWIIKRQYTSFDRIFDCLDSTGLTNGFDVEITSAYKIQFLSKNVSSTTSTVLGVRNNKAELMHVVITHDGTGVKIYENGVLIAQDTSAVFTITPGNIIYVGRRSAGGNLGKFKIGEIVFHNTTTTWTQAQITDLYYNGVIPSGASYWLFNGDVLDGSGNGNHGTLTGGTYIDRTATRESATRSEARGNYEIKQGTLLEDFQTIGDWTRGGAAGSIAEDTEHFTEGDRSLALTFASGTSVFYDKTISTVVGGNLPAMLLKVYIPSLTNLGSIALYIASASNFSKYFSKTIQATSLHEGYNYIPISPSEWSATGGELWSNTMVRLRIRVNATTGTPSVSFCSIHTYQYNRPKVVVTFDDSWDSQYSKAFAYMSPIGLKGTIYAIGSKLGTTNYCTIAQLREMYSAGWDICNHGSVNLTTLGTQAEQETEISREEAYISEFTRSNKHYAYPSGGYNNNARNALLALGYKTARTIIDRQQANYLDEKYLITRYGVYNGTSVNSAKGYIDRAIEQGSSVWLNYHLIVDSDADVSTKVLTADFNEIMDYIKAKVSARSIDCVTVSEWYNGLAARQPVTTPRTTV